MKRYQYDRKFFSRVLGVFLLVSNLISPNGYAKDVELIKLSDSVREVQVNMADQESHNLYKTVAYQGTCTKTDIVKIGFVTILTNKNVDIKMFVKNAQCKFVIVEQVFLTSHYLT